MPTEVQSGIEGKNSMGWVGYEEHMPAVYHAPTHPPFSLLCREMKALWGLTSCTDAVHKELRTTPYLLFSMKTEEHLVSFLKVKLHHGISFSPMSLFEVFYIQ